MEAPFVLAISQMDHILRQRFVELSKDIDIPRPLWRVLLTVADLEGQHQALLSEALMIEQIRLTRYLDQLEQLGLVERHLDPADRRVRRVHLTKAALPVVAQMNKILGELEKEAVEGLSVTAVQQVLKVLLRARRNVDGKLASPAAAADRSLAEFLE
jgi:MarR family transcriptional regulator, transcriptional regulator for hemolysin